ncbi:tetratricopeptide repeat protein [Enhygromyxa salina]|uniref:Photosystem I assembly protein Ycf3 n=1 Tax=Enhygromyxa salina TaxID=215803 RepID=A0A2S9Y4B7_9BACT|nr:tetratricopeptide repeat protein [Enhygromyxa salina]PRP99943.1 photosystem I assembly protein Ycf3 [Enhygromyxa salina]
MPRSLSLCLFGLLIAGCNGESGSRSADQGRASAAAPVSGPPTFAADVAPIIYANCAVCHHDGGAGPFTLRSYDDVSDHAEQIVEVTQSGFMPPWLPREGYGNFEGERHLSAAHKQLLADWVAGGRLPGDLSTAPSFPSFASGWQLGPPDLELQAEAAYELPAEGRDIYRNFVISVPPGPTRFVKTVELAPGSPKVVHHAVMRVDVEGEARRLDAADPEPGFDGMVFAGATMPGGHFIGWTPGRTADPGDDDRSWPLTGGTDIVVQVHLRPTGKPERIQPKLGLHFAAHPPPKPALAMVLSSTAIDIAPGDSDFRVVDTFELPVDVRVLSVYPHAHYVGKQLEGFATLPDGSRQWLVKIDDWDFNWQDQYRYEHPIALPKGSVITMDHRYDNSAQNPRNPFSPPQRVVFGANSTDEMAELILEVEPVNPAEIGVLDEASRLAWLSVQIETIERALAEQPNDPELLANLAGMLSHGGRHAEARDRYQASLAQRDDASTRVELAIVLTALDQLPAAELELDAALGLEPEHARAHLVRGNHRRLAEQYTAALASYERAIAADPELVEAHNNLGVTHEKLDQPARAATAFARAAQLSPGRSLFWENLGRAHEAAQQYDEALAAYRTALDCNINSFKAMRGLAWILATHADPSKRDPTQALALAEAAGRATGFRSPEVLEALAAGLAASGRFEPATEAIGRAIELAQLAKRPDLEARYRAHAALFGRRQAIVLGAPD